ncbi:glycoside hydrolase family 26 protein [Plantactinospora sp. KBS50]|uniref:glycoside hydrolase family 26 protein n=1 Tax=Plantactinospora sp. KBS50 TaxID=2024580 RepID=UPI000BAA9797|nr:glycosyl hydrolase [Plantactinospora sp. KBS50]ASW52942.1 beta-mannanase [Plantactinospora sp. KBS50]
MLRLTVPRIAAVLIAAALLTYAFVVAPRTGAQPRTAAGLPGPTGTVAMGARPSPSAEPELFPPAGKAFIGLTTDAGPYDFAATEEFTKAAGRAPQVMLFSVGWATTRFDRTLFDRIANRGMMPMLGWEPWDYRLDQQARDEGYGPVTIDRIRSKQPDYRLARITGGDFDDYVLSWAAGIKSLGYPVAIRFAHEMNGNWYPWSEMVNGNRAGDYVRAWRHVHDLFVAAGAGNVVWVWSPNAEWDDSTPRLSTLYPGDSYVDWLGISGYYGTGAFADYRSFDSIFNSTIKQIRTFSDRPLVITETAATDASGRKAEWIKQTFQVLPRHPDIIGLIWFEADKELDWRIVSSRSSARAFAQAVAGSRYDVSWSSTKVPRTQLGN